MFANDLRGNEGLTTKITKEAKLRIAAERQRGMTTIGEKRR